MTIKCKKELRQIELFGEFYERGYRTTLETVLHERLPKKNCRCRCLADTYPDLMISQSKRFQGRLGKYRDDIRT